MGRSDMSVLVIYTGGTFGMQPSAAGLVPSDNIAELIEKHADLEGCPSFDIHAIKPAIDSSNIMPEQWQTIADVIIKHYQEYSGFVVIHGTDTLAFTSSILSFLLQGLDKTVVVTGAQIPLALPKNDAEQNFKQSLHVANASFNEVVIVFDQKVLRGNRSTKFDSSELAAFQSPTLAPVADLKTDSYEILSSTLKNDDLKLENLSFNNHAVGIIALHPGINPTQLLTLASCYKGIILRTFGTGNMPTANAEFYQALKTLHQQGLILVNTSQCPTPKVKMGHYADSAVGDDITLLNGHNMTMEAAFTKLHYLLAKGLESDQIKIEFERNIAGELDN